MTETSFLIERETKSLFVGTKEHGFEWSNEGVFQWENGDRRPFPGDYIPEVAPVVHGRWEPRTDIPGFVRCSACRDCNTYDEWPDGQKWKFCPQCGAKMDLEVT